MCLGVCLWFLKDHTFTHNFTQKTNIILLQQDAGSYLTFRPCLKLPHFHEYTGAIWMLTNKG